MKLSFTILLFLLCTCTFTFTQVKSQIIDKRDGSVYKTVLINNKTWMVDNLNASIFRNGDKIPVVKSYKEWIKACNKEEPACCYFNNKKKNGKVQGLLYNWYAVNDSRGLAPEGMEIPSEVDFASLVNYYCNEGANKYSSDWTLTENCNQYSISKLCNAFRLIDSKARINGSFLNTNGLYLWTSSNYNQFDGISFWISKKGDKFKVVKSQKLDAYAVRCFQISVY